MYQLWYSELDILTLTSQRNIPVLPLVYVSLTCPDNGSADNSEEMVWSRRNILRPKSSEVRTVVRVTRLRCYLWVWVQGKEQKWKPTRAEEVKKIRNCVSKDAEITQDNKELALTTPSELIHECFTLMFNLFQFLSPK